ncbi:putative superfamily III holin-X [Actinomadura pelletieri DSM 43383]|uniref:Putative superfamily III holin-X n=1 Tax=Actinomadura pelletieri DSM 43383 TaxID=1120940 RepID=A0A495QTV6_9ACTN|nr:phage holin family protein [Actinomadura pelletieri]RKS76893.1 putative superfamily III holin-X [Actinomadura pelletieri DSM 43383]
MTESYEPAEIDDSLEQNLVLVRRVIDAANEEMAAKARQRLPALRFGAVAGAFGVMAAAATYRMNVILLEKKLPPELASFVAAAVYGSGAGAAALAASRKWKGLPPPLPSQTVRQVLETIADNDRST